MAYTKTNWVNGGAPAINATNLNKIEQGIYDTDVKAGTAETTANAALPAEDFTDTNMLGALAASTAETFSIGPSMSVEETNIKVGVDTPTASGGLVASVVIGNLAGENLVGTNNFQNVFVGYKTGQAAILTACTMIGAKARASASGVTNEVAIGFNTQGRGSNTAQVGNDSVTNIYYGPGTGTAFTNISDRRLKEEITDADVGMCYADIKALPLHRFRYKDFIGNTGDQHLTGFIADEFEQVFPKAVIKRDKIVEIDGEKVTFEACASIDTSQVVPTLLGALQKLMAKVEQLEVEIALLKP